MKVSAVQAMVISSLPSMATSFVAPPAGAFSHGSIGKSPSALNLEDHIADMIDNELYRLHHKHETDEQWLKKQREWSRMEPKLPSDFDFEEAIGQSAFEMSGENGATVQGFSSGVNRSISSPQRRKDKKMAEDDPMRYCADRCVSTGNCDVFEDMFEMGPAEVIKFCKECVLSEDEEPCDVPAKFLDDEGSSSLHP